MTFSGGLSVAIQICYRAVVENGRSAPAKCGFAGYPTSVWGCADLMAGADSGALLGQYAQFWRVASALRQGAATSHSPLWRGAATPHEDTRHRQKL